MKDLNEIEKNQVTQLRNQNEKLSELLAKAESENSELKSIIEKQTKRFFLLNKYSIELAEQTDNELLPFIVNRFKSIFHVREVWISTYNEKKHELEIKASTLSQKDNARLAKFIGKKMNGYTTYVDQKQYNMMLNSGISGASSLHEISLGQIPLFISTALEKVFNIGWVQGIALTDKGRLVGTLVLAAHVGQPELYREELNTFTNITSFYLRHKNAEIELIASEKRFRQFADFLPQLVYELDTKGNITFANQASLALFGYTKEELKSGINLFQLIIPEHIVKVSERLNEILNGASTYPTEYHVRKKNGEVIQLLIHTVLFKEDGVRVGIRGVGIDISNLKKAESEIHHKNEQLQKINSEKDKFFSIIAHDLKSPFNNFLGFTQVMTEEIDSMSISDIKKISKVMRKSAINLYELLDNLLEWAKIQRGAMEFHPETFNLKDRILSVVEILLENANKKEISIEAKTAENLFVQADKHMFDSLIRNLLSNAIKFTHRGGMILITVSEVIDRYVIVCVADNGIGIQKSKLEKLFKLAEVATNKGTDGEPSSGLGLLLCKEFAEKHGGNLTVESTVGQGSRFSFNLPVAEGEASKLN
jgi:PAS domain S-box-containing protein